MATKSIILAWEIPQTEESRGVAPPTRLRLELPHETGIILRQRGKQPSATRFPAVRATQWKTRGPGTALFSNCVLEMLPVGAGAPMSVL